MKNRTEDLEKYAVRIKSQNKYLGSGVLWKPLQQGEDNYLYIFTAAHVVKDSDDIEVEFLRNGAEVKLPIEKNMIEISETYHNEGDFRDAAIIVVNYEYKELPSFRFISFQNELPDLHEGEKITMMGFPKEGYIGESLKLSMDPMHLTYVSVDNEISMLKYKLYNSNIDQSNRNEEMVGFSGAGLFYDIGSEFVFVGIHKGSIGSSGERGSLIGTTSDYIRFLCSKNKWNIPILYNAVNGNLSDQIEYFNEEILEDLEWEDKKNISLLLNDVTKSDMSDVIKGFFCDFCEECRYKTNYHQCKNFRGFLLALSVFLKLVDDNIDLKKPQIVFEKEIPVYFVCSEGQIRNTQAKLKMSHFIYALKSQRELSHRIEDGCIIIWGSIDEPRDNEKKCEYSGYMNVLNNIARMPGNNLDITSIFWEPGPKAIIHIGEIINMLREGSLQNLKDKFAEYIEELKK